MHKYAKARPLPANGSDNVSFYSKAQGKSVARLGTIARAPND